MKTESIREQDVERDWYVVDLDNKVLGRAATRIATILRGKHKLLYPQRGLRRSRRRDQRRESRRDREQRRGQGLLLAHQPPRRY